VNSVLDPNDPELRQRLREHLISLEGGRAVRWLLMRSPTAARLRRSLVTLGAVDFFYPYGERLPTWFAWAVLALKKRKEFWRVSVTNEVKGRRYRIKWRAVADARLRRA